MQPPLSPCGPLPYRTLLQVVQERFSILPPLSLGQTLDLSHTPPAEPSPPAPLPRHPQQIPAVQLSQRGPQLGSCRGAPAAPSRALRLRTCLWTYPAADFGCCGQHRTSPRSPEGQRSRRCCGRGGVYISGGLGHWVFWTTKAAGFP